VDTVEVVDSPPPLLIETPSLIGRNTRIAETLSETNYRES
jgi:hypothetical protein